MKISISKAKELLQLDQVVGLPTETVYGLGASIYCPKAIEQIYILKNRPANNPLIVHVSDILSIEQFSLSVPASLASLGDVFWPGPLTVILQANEKMIPAKARAGLPTVAFRIPSHPFALDILQDIGPIVMPSANRSGRPSATCREHIEIDFGINFPVLDGGHCERGIESTILYYVDGIWKIARLGALCSEDFVSVLGYAPELIGKKESATPICPGQIYRHYSPKARLSLERNSTSVVLGFSDRVYPEARQSFLMGSSHDPNEVAANLYNSLRELDAEGVDQAWIDMEFGSEGLWATIRERLQKAQGG